MGFGFEIEKTCHKRLTAPTVREEALRCNQCGLTLGRQIDLKKAGLTITCRALVYRNTLNCEVRYMTLNKNLRQATLCRGIFNFRVFSGFLVFLAATVLLWCSS